MLALKNPDDCKMVLSMIKEILAALPKTREPLTAKLCEQLNALPSATALGTMDNRGIHSNGEGMFPGVGKVWAPSLPIKLRIMNRRSNQRTSQSNNPENKSCLLPALLFSVGKLLAVLYANKSANYKEFRCKAISFLLHVLKYCKAEVRLDKECIDRAWTVLNTAIFPERLGAHFATKAKDEDLVPSRKVALHAHTN